jgi:hypothetical protein
LATSGFPRRLLWWNLLVNTPAGVSCGATDVAEWVVIPRAATAAQPWYQATSSPGATAIAPLSEYFGSRDFWRLQPIPQTVAPPSGTNLLRRPIVAASTESRDWLVAYAPDERAVNLAHRFLPARTGAAWFNPRTAATVPANAVNGTTSYNFVPPGPGDWLLVLNARK